MTRFTDNRETSFRMSISAIEHKEIEEITKSWRLSASDVVRMLIRQEHERLVKEGKIKGD